MISLHGLLFFYMDALKAIFFLTSIHLMDMIIQVCSIYTLIFRFHRYPFPLDDNPLSMRNILKKYDFFYTLPFLSNSLF
jgi:hypothetical protein